MVRDKNIIYAEVNDEDTVLTEDILTDNSLLVGNFNKNIKKVLDSTKYGAIIFIIDNEVQILPIQPNKKLGTDTNGNLAWI